MCVHVPRCLVAALIVLFAEKGEAQRFIIVRPDSARPARVRDEIMILTTGDWDDEQLGLRVAKRLTSALAPAHLQVRVTSAAGLDGIALPASGMARLRELRELMRIHGPRLALALVRDSDDPQRVAVAMLPIDDSDVRLLGTWLVGGYETAATGITARVSADSSFQRVRASKLASQSP